MSEYQYYEFQAVDRPLTQAEMAELRARSTRASITPSRFQNVYHWGDLKGNPLDWMERYFDAFVYVANWGTHQYMVRLPSRLFDADMARRYEVEESLTIHARGEAVILEFVSHDDEGGGWIEDEEAASWMPALLPLRGELASGDVRALYLAWLASASAGLPDGQDAFDREDDEFGFEDDELDDEEIEPPVPPGLGQLSASLKTLAEFLRIDDDLLAVAAAASPELLAEPSSDDLQRWIADLPAAEKDALLLQLADNAVPARAELLRRFRRDIVPPPEAAAGGRTVAALLAAAEERQAAEQARREREAAVARARYLDSLAPREEDLWREIDALVETKKPKEYDQAVQLLTDLRDLSAHQNRTAAFAARLSSLRDRYAKRPSLRERLERAGLGA